ncbi:transposase [Streptomyces canus]|uniref:transposase n=1 Tax=Streptomyces canus TaxID=58343 RepID=UPI0036C59DCE
MTITIRMWVMGEIQKIRTDRHCTFVTQVHLVFVTNFQHNAFTRDHLRRIGEIMRSVCTDLAYELVEFTGENGHVHLLVNSLKGVSSRRLRLGVPPGRRLGESSPTWYATTGGPTSCRLLLRRHRRRRPALPGQAVHRTAEPAGVSTARLRRT